MLFVQLLLTACALTARCMAGAYVSFRPVCPNVPLDLSHPLMTHSRHSSLRHVLKSCCSSLGKETDVRRVGTAVSHRAKYSWVQIQVLLLTSHMTRGKLSRTLSLGLLTCTARKITTSVRGASSTKGQEKANKVSCCQIYSPVRWSPWI